MTNFKLWLQRRIGRRNIPFLGAVIALAAIILILMHYSPRTDSSREVRSPLVATD